MLPSPDAEARRAIFASKIETLAKLHTYDPQAIGLGDFRQARQLFRAPGRSLDKQYRASETQHIPEFEKLGPDDGVVVLHASRPVRSNRARVVIAVL